jgi:transposase
MIQIAPQMPVLVAIEPVDGRKGMDSLARLCQEKLAEDPFSGGGFVFRSRSGTAIRLLSDDGQGYWLAQKRLSRGRFMWWPEGSEPAKPRFWCGKHLPARTASQPSTTVFFHGRGSSPAESPPPRATSERCARARHTSAWAGSRASPAAATRRRGSRRHAEVR